MSPQQQCKQTQHTRVFCLHVVVLVLFYFILFWIFRFISSTIFVVVVVVLLFAVAFWFRHLALCNIRYRSDKAASGWSVWQPKKKASLSLYIHWLRCQCCLLLLLLRGSQLTGKRDIYTTFGTFSITCGIDCTRWRQSFDPDTQGDAPCHHVCICWTVSDTSLSDETKNAYS